MLNIFPRSGFDQSVTTPVLLGVLVSWFFTETYGWIFAGLVVPGYLAAVFLLNPASGIIDVVEAFITFGIARAIGETLPRTGLMSRVFGRERFFLVVLVSVLVRLAVEAWALPTFLPRLTFAFSIGLVVTPLLANACWKTGLARGIIQNGVPTLIVYLLLRYVLVPHTNLSLEGFVFATENVGAKFLASPKAYILLVIGALLAASANVRYGWDFNGILVPALVGLVVVEPRKLAATFVETLVLYATVLVLIKLTPLKRANIEGPRRPVLFFTVDYALRFAFAAIAGRSLPGGDIVAFMGFGYLLPTLLAVKISQKSSAPLVLLPTLKVSVAGFAVGTMIGFAAHRVDLAFAGPPPAPSPRPLPPAPADPRAAAVWAAAFTREAAEEPPAMRGYDRSTFRKLLYATAAGDAPSASRLALDTWKLENGVVLLRERTEKAAIRTGAPSFLVAPKREGVPNVILVPSPAQHPALALYAGEQVAQGKVHIAVISGVDEPERIGLETAAHEAARALAQGGGLRVLRAKGEPAKERGFLARLAETDPGGDAAETIQEVDEAALAARISPPPDPIPLDTSLAMSIALEDVKPTSHELELEEFMLVRRFLLEPLLGSAPPNARALAPFVAASAGYAWHEGGRWVDGSAGIALVPTSGDRTIAALARASSLHARVVVAPFATDKATRDVALRLTTALRADAVVLGESFDGALREGAIRAAIASVGAATSMQPREIFVVRSARSGDPNAIAISTWLDDGDARTRALDATKQLGVTPIEQPSAPYARELAVRSAPDPKAFVVLEVGEKARDTLSLESARRAAERFESMKLRAFDGTVAEAARALAKKIDPKALPCADDIDTVVRSAGTDFSIAAQRRLEAELSKGCAASLLVRAPNGTFIVVVARGASKSVVVAASTDPTQAFERVDRASLDECTSAPVVPGSCTARTP